MQIDITFDQILAYIKQLSKKDKMRISRELEQDGRIAHLPQGRMNLTQIHPEGLTQ